MACHIGPLQRWSRRDRNDWVVAWDRIAGDENTLLLGVDEEKPDTIEWHQWIAGKEDDMIYFLPIMQERSLIIRPQSSMHLATGLNCVFFALIPISVIVYAGSNKELRLVEIPTMVLSNTWHGDTMSGELCYSLRFPAQYSLDTSEVGPHRVVCPVYIKNESDNELEFQRLCLQVKHLNIYEGVPNNLTDKVTVVYKGRDQDSKIHYENHASSNGRVPVVISSCREPLSESVLRRRFDSLMSISF
jgi:hypothetical protein